MNPNQNPNTYPNQTTAQQTANIPLPNQTLANSTNINCGKCKKPLSEFSYFCPNCGNKIIDKPFKLTIKNIIYVMTLSIFFPPLGIFPGFKYLRYKETGAKLFGLLAIIITLIFTYLMFYIFMNFMNEMSSSYYNINNLGDKTSITPANIIDQIKVLKQLY